MRRALLPLVGIYAYLAFLLSLLVFLPLVAWARLRNGGDPSFRLPGRWVRRLGKTCWRLMPIWRGRVVGAAPDDIRHRPYVVVSNHVSSADPLLLSLLPWDMRWVAKEELFRLPIGGWILRLGGDIPIRRGQAESVRAMFRACEETLAAGLSVMLFPEGTRSRDGSLLPFRDGAFELAIRAQVPVLPVIVAGTRDCRPKGSLWFGWARAQATLLAPVPTEGRTLADVPALREEVRERMKAAMQDTDARAQHP